jgi:Spondin_N
MGITKKVSAAALVTGIAALVVAPSAMASREYDVTITDLTGGPPVSSGPGGQPLSPPVAAIHEGRHQVFEVGQPASVGIREIAENGNNKPLVARLNVDPFNVIADFEEAGAPLVPVGVPGDDALPNPPDFEQSVTLELRGSANANRLSVATMLICTNDGFTGVDSVKLPQRVGDSKVRDTNGYDAHTEMNTQNYADIVPPCQDLIGRETSAAPGTDKSDPALAEGGVIEHHLGIVGPGGVNFLAPAIHGWTDPVARVEVERTG